MEIKTTTKIKLYALDNTPVDNLDNQCLKWATEDDRKKIWNRWYNNSSVCFASNYPGYFFLLSLGSMQFRNAMGHILE